LCRAFTRNVVNSFGLVLRATRATLLAGTAAILPAGYADLASAQTPRLRVLTLRLPEVESSRSVTLATRHPSPFWLPIRRPPPSIRCFARPRTATRAARPEPPPRTVRLTSSRRRPQIPIQVSSIRPATGSAEEGMALANPESAFSCAYTLMAASEDVVELSRPDVVPAL
jgi:hypothetical protein